MFAAVFKQIEGAAQVVFSQLPCAGLPIDTSQNARIRSGINRPVARR